MAPFAVAGTMTRLLTMDEIEAHLTMADCLAALERMFEELGHGRAITDSREDVLTPVPSPAEDAVPPVYHGLKSMGGSIPALGVGAIRINSDVIHWPYRDDARVREKLPLAPGGRYTGLVLLFSTDTGEPLAIFPDGVVQSFRVGGTSALGAKVLARDDARTLGLLGAGWQARAHLLAHDACQSLDRVRVYAPTPASREAFVDEMADRVDPDLEAVDTPEAAVRDADILQSVTNSLAPVFELDWLEPGMHVGVIHDREAPAGLFDPSAYDAFVQSWSTVVQFEERGNQLVEREIPTKNVNNYVVEAAEPVPRFSDRSTTREPLCDWSLVPGLGDVMVDDSLGRTTDDGITVFYNRGMGVQFAAVGKALFDVAEREGLGHDIPTELLTQTYHP